MLAYVLWHWKQAQIAAGDYEAHQRRFHAALAAAPPTGFLQSFSVALPQAPSAAILAAGEVYEDWYFVEDFTALGLLNEGAVSASRLAPHNAAAAGAGGAAAGVYGLKLGSAISQPQHAYWFGKPSGMPYAEFIAQLTPLVDQAHGALWMRQMVLGSTPEFCLHAAAPVTFPDAFNPLALPLRSVWSALS